MDSLLSSMAKQNTNNPSSPYYLGQPSTIQTIKNYMSGIGNFGGYTSPNRTNYYVGQPTQDQFVSIENVSRRRKQEALFIGAAGTILAGLGLIIARKIPVINLIPKLIGGILGCAGKLIGEIGKLAWKVVK